MRITVLGKSPAWQDAGGACSGYLIQDDAVSLLLDCGSGVFGKLRSHIDHLGLDAVLITHLHADHVLDLVPFASALAYSPRQQVPAPARPVLHAPPGARDAFRALCGGAGMAAEHVERSFELHEYDPGETLRIGRLEVRWCPVAHFVPAYAVEVSSPAGDRFTFSADTGPSDGLVEFARDSDLLLIEATLEHPEPEGPRGHLTSSEAGEHGRRAGVSRLVLTHLSDELDAERAREEASRSFRAPVEIAAEGAVYELPGGRTA